MSAANASVSSSSLDAERRAHEPSMEEILASIRRIIADDEGVAPERSENEEEPRVAAERASSEQCDEPEQESPAPSIGRDLDAYPAPVLEPHDWRWRERQLTHPAADQALELLEAIETNQPSPQEVVVAEVAAATLDEPLDDEPSFDDASHPPEREDCAADSRYYVADEDDDRAAAAEAAEFDGAEPIDEPEPEQEVAPGAPLVSPDAAAAIAAQFQTLAATMVINDSGLLHRYAQEMLRPMLKQWLDDNLPVIVERLVRSEIERVARGGRR